MSYRSNKKWRLAHTQKRNASRKRYYKQFQRNAIKKGKRWTYDEIDLILMSNDTDRKLQKELGRSVQAIQIKRCRFWQGL